MKQPEEEAHGGHEPVIIIVDDAMPAEAEREKRAIKKRAKLDRRAALMRANQGRLPERPAKITRSGPLKIRPGKSLVGLTIPERIR